MRLIAPRAGRPTRSLRAHPYISTDVNGSCKSLLLQESPLNDMEMVLKEVVVT
jgi:hypothetical protein